MKSKSDITLNETKQQNRDNLEQIGLLSQKLDEMNEERQVFSNLVRSEMKRVIENIAQHLGSDNNNSSRQKAQELLSFYRKLVQFMDEKQSNDLMKYD